jgi:hypothetical protein
MDGEVAPQQTPAEKIAEIPHATQPTTWQHLREMFTADMWIAVLLATMIVICGYLFLRPSLSTEQEVLAASESERGTGTQFSGSSADSQSKAEVGVVVQTIIGPLRFSTTHEVGRLGDYLCHLYFNSRDTADIYSRLPAKRDTVHGLDAVYIRRPQRGRKTVIVVENKVNGSKYNPVQLADSTVRKQCQRMQSSPDEGVWKTSSLILAAMQGHQEYSLERLLMRHDLVNGVSTRTRVGSNGKTIAFSSRKKNVAKRLRRILEDRVNKGRYERVS